MQPVGFVDDDGSKQGQAHRRAGRDPVELELDAIADLLTGEVALVTGAGGSIGAELCRQIVKFAPSRLVLVERAEPALWAIHRELSLADVLGTCTVIDLAAERRRARGRAVRADLDRQGGQPDLGHGGDQTAGRRLRPACFSQTGRTYLSVRFGNVLGSTGSVVPVFEQQIAKARVGRSRSPTRRCVATS